MKTQQTKKKEKKKKKKDKEKKKNATNDNVLGRGSNDLGRGMLRYKLSNP